MADAEHSIELQERADKPLTAKDDDDADNESNNDEHESHDRYRLDDGSVGVPTKHSGIPGATMNFVNSIIGAGIIGLPSALNKSGFCFGLFLMVLVAMMIDYGVRHLIECGLKVRRTSYEGTMQYAFGNAGFYMASTAIFGFAYGAMIAYHIVIGDTIPKIFQTMYPESILCNRSLVVGLYSIVFMLPLSLLKNMASLDKTSTISFTAVIVIVFTVTIEGARVTEYKDLTGLKPEHLLINSQWFAGVGTMAFAFVCHHNSFVIYKSLRNATQKRWDVTTHSSMIISVFWSMWLAIAGFFCFQTDTEGDVLNNFSYDNVVVNCARGLLALTMVFTYPMEVFVARHSILQCVKLSNNINTQNENKWFYLITVILWSTSALIGAFVWDLGVVLEVVGVVCGASIGFIFPGLVSLRVFGWHALKHKMVQTYKANHGRGKKYSCKDRTIAGWNFIFPIFMATFGVVIMIMGLTTIFLTE
eukprot:40731_1